ncbi:TIGR04028 family ABC transporter substrate-binding protein [Ruania zhangjianzhongii]|uniref:TIGR04028 family ABC transporter substrate-binding protein n=1 Tax=Ruania zhangjianzhongii TaxID=2603206 RepID=UPI001F46340E|nr:TIGR04028 family ABC transporter substrate-binding protein [Ruania zhangjianzhongii]
MSPRRHRTAARGAALATAAALMLAACGGSGDAADTGGSGEPVAGGTLVYLDKGTFDTLYPPEAGFYPNGGLVNNITDRLVHQNPQTLEFEPWLATDWEINEDATEYTFTLRDDVTFSDGTPLTAEAVAANFDLYGLGDDDRALIVSEAVNNYESSEVIDDTHVTFHFSVPAPGFLQATATINSGILAPSTLAFAYEDFGPGNATAVIGTGPFVISDEEIGASVTLTAREDYDWAPESADHQGRAYLDEVQVQVTPEASVRVGALLSGQADIVREVPAQDEERVAGAGLDLFAPQTRGVNNVLSLRIGNDILADLRVRQALIAGIDREAVTDTLFTENYPLATSILSSEATGYIDTSEYYAYDPERAAELLDEAGWEVGPDGIRVKDGEPLTITVNEALPQPRSFDVVTQISQQLREIGVDLQILRADAGTYAQAIQDPDQVQIYHSMVGRADMDVIKSQLYSANRNSLLNRDPETDEITDPELETLLEAVAAEPNHEDRIAASQAVQVYVAENAYVIPLFEEPQVFGAQPDTHGFGTESVGRPSFYGVWLDR